MAGVHRVGGASSQPSQPTPAAVKALQLEYKRIVEEPVEGFRVSLEKEDNLFEWRVAIFGPPGTPYAGGYFIARMRFPYDYPYNPPTVKFVSKIWHPNIYEVSPNVTAHSAVLKVQVVCFFLSRTATCVSQSCTRPWTILKVVNCRANAGIQRRTFAPSC